MVDTAAETAGILRPLFHREIDFVRARRQFTGFSNGGGGGFRLETLNPTTSDPEKQGEPERGIDRAAVAKKRSHSAESVELSFGFSLMRIGAGLVNRGNTCYLNSVLQCLTYTEPLAAYLQSGRHKSYCRKAGFCALCAIQNHVNRALQSAGRSFVPQDLVSNLRCISRNFREARQEDAHEYMVNLLESMHRCCLPSGVPSESPSAFEKSLVHEIFGGRLRSQVKCMQCSFCSDKFDPFLDLSLEINKADSLQKALAHFTAKEYLDGGAKEYQCERCRQKVKALKQLSIHKAPNVLSIHLKRFGCHQPGQKINKKVHFGSTLDLKSFVTGAYDGDLKYTLYGVLVHDGWSTHSGHYYCFVRTSSGMWHSLDDHKVGTVSEKTVLEEKAYMLFYVRDRKDVIPKKPVDIGRAKNMIINAMGNRIQSSFNQVPNKLFQNGPTGKRAESLLPSPAVTRVDVAVAGALKETITKGKSIQGTAQETVSVSSSLENEVQLNTSSVMPVVQDDVKVLSNGGDCSKKSVIANGSVGGLDIVAFVATDNECNKARSTKENPSDLDVVSPNSNSLQNSHIKNYSTEVLTTHKNNQENLKKNRSVALAIKSECNGIHNSSADSRIEDGILLKDCKEKRPKIVDLSSQVEETSNVNIQIGGHSKERNDSGSSKEMELSGLESTKSITTPRKSTAHKRQRKLRKKFSKSQITITRLSSGIILGAAFSVRKKLQKKVKRSAFKIDIPTGDHLGPSTSEPTRPLPITLNSTRKESKPISSKSENISTVKNGKGYYRNLVEGAIDEKSRDGVGQNGDVVALDRATQCNPSSPLARNGSVGSEGNILKDSRRDSMQNGILNILTRGLEETIVARWDEIEQPPPNVTGRNGEEPVRVGYIGDDWDEEYDKGKRKKVKTSITDFDGPNPFQEIATRNAKLKKVKLDRSSSANQPFRI